MGKSEWAGNVVATLIGLLIALVLCEVILHFYNPLPAVVKSGEVIMRANARSIIKNEFNPHLDKEILYTTNDIGFRGDDPPASFNDYLTIIAVGGSTTMCNYNSDDKTWPELLGKQLNQSLNNVWINNAGINGHSTFGHTLLLSDKIIKLKPKVVLFLIGVNDIGTINPAPFMLYNPDNIIGKIKQFIYKSEVVGLFVSLSRIFAAVKYDLDHKINFDLTTAEHVERSSLDIENYLKRHREKYISNFGKRVTNLVKISKDNGIIPVLLTQPLLLGNIHDPVTNVDLSTIKIQRYLEEEDSVLTGNDYWRLLELYNDETRRVAKELGVKFIDLAYKLPKTSEYFYDPMHYTNAGNAKISEIIDDELKDYLENTFPGYKKRESR